MSTGLFRNKIYKISVGIITICFTLFCVGYAHFLSRAEAVWLGTSFFYLITDDTHLEAGAEFVKLEGGAGYLLRHDGADCVVLSVYLNEADGVAVQTSLTAKGEAVQLIQISVPTLYFKSKAEKQNANIYVGALKTLHGCMMVLNECMARLEDGATQESSKRILTPLEMQLTYLSKEYAVKYPKFSVVCKETAETLGKISAKTLFAKDLRYLLCELSEKYVALASAFSM